MPDFGSCRDCPTPAVVKLNGAPLCIDHYDDELHRVTMPIRLLTAQLRSVSDENGPHDHG